MSSEEETDSQGLCDGLDRKQKRSRQRVDAGEPRNSYSSVPNFNARPGFMSGGIYGAIFNQGRQHFGLFGPGYAPKMLNELLGRPKQESEEEAGADLNVFRDILRKKELMQLERELRGGVSPDNNNVLANNNNDEPKRESKMEEDCDRLEESDCRDSNQDPERREIEDAMRAMNGTDSRSLPSPSSVEGLVTPKMEPEMDVDKDGPRSPNSVKGEGANAKRARVENIVSTMRSSPAPPVQPQVNGCKKRKLYHPQQHDGERYGVNSHLSIEDEEEESERSPIQIQKLVQKSVLETHLKALQDQLAEMQQKYVQLCNQREHESETQDDKTSSDVEHIEDSEKPSPVASPKELHTAIQNNQANMLSQMMSKMITAKMGHVPHPIPPGFNGSVNMMPHLPPNHDSHPNVRPPNPPHPNFSNAAAMYFSQKLFMEQQQARMKEAAQAAELQSQHHQKTENSQPQSQQHSPNMRTPLGSNKASALSTELQERLEAFRSNANSANSISGADLEGLAEVLKNEITASLTTLIDSIVNRFVNQRRYLGKQSEAAAAAAEQLNKDLMLTTRLLERKSPPNKQSERSSQLSGNPPVHSTIPPSSCSGGIPNGVHFMNHNGSMTPVGQMNGPRPNGPFPQHTGPEPPTNFMNQNTHNRPPPTGLFQTPKPPQGMSSIYAAMNGSVPFCVESNQEQSEALSLVVTPGKKKRHKVTDTRITPRTVNRILSEGAGPSPVPEQQNKFPDSPSPRPYHPSLPTSVAIPNPSLHESQVFSSYSPFFAAHGPLGPNERLMGQVERDSPPLPHPPALLHPALVAAAHHASPDYMLRQHFDQDPHSPGNSADISYDGMQPTHSSTLTPMHLRKAKLMFFWVRYPSSAVLKMYFPDIKFNKNNTAQLVKWFSNFREFYYIQMEKYARQAISEGAKSADELHVAGDSEIYRVLNLHYNRNNHIEVPSNFRYVVEQTLREFYRAIQGGKDTEQSWKKSIYKVISRLDDPVPEYFKSPNFLEQLE